MTAVAKLGDYQVGFDTPEECHAFLVWLENGDALEVEDIDG